VDEEEEKGGRGVRGADWLAAAARAQVVSHMRYHPDAFNHSVETGDGPAPSKYIGDWFGLVWFGLVWFDSDSDT
jgi:hypothetical protein